METTADDIHRQRMADPDWWCNNDPSRPCERCRMNVAEQCNARTCIVCQCQTKQIGDFLYLFRPRLKYNSKYCYSTCTVRICRQCNGRCARFTADKPNEIPAGWDAWDVYDEIGYALSQRPKQYEYKAEEFPSLG